LYAALRLQRKEFWIEWWQKFVTVAFVNNKGGVGKTTTAVTLAAVLAERHGPILLVDLDSQASASRSLGISRAALTPSIAQALLEGLPIGRAIRPSGIEQLDLITGSIDLASTDVALAEVPNRERFLGTLLEGVRSEYRYILIDTAPSLSLLGVNALVASDTYVIPATPQALALEGVTALVESVERLTRRLRLSLKLAGVLLTIVNGQEAHAREFAEQFRSQLRDRVFHTEIPADPRVAAAPSFGRTVLAHAPESPAADAYRRAAGELLQRLAT
jgi:chromosome partitioning protein